MKIITKTLLLTIILIFFPLKSFAHVEHYEKVEKFLMEIFKDGKKIGFNNYTFNKNKENLVIDNQTEFNVSILGLKAFSIKGASKEVYKNNKLISFKSDTIQNKKKKFVELYLDESKESYFLSFWINVIWCRRGFAYSFVYRCISMECISSRNIS